MGAKPSSATQSSSDIAGSTLSGSQQSAASAAAMGTSASRRRTLSGSTGANGNGLILSHHHHHSNHVHHHQGAVSSSDARQRARSLSHVTAVGPSGEIFDLSGGTPDSDGSSTPEETTGSGGGGAGSGAFSLGTYFGTRVYAAHSLPTQLSSAFNGIKCPVCSKFVIPEDIECHLVMCLTKPRISYNEDVLREDKGECVICLDDLKQGDTIARLPCLCIYHKSCIDSWFEVNRSCPEHPLD